MGKNRTALCDWEGERNYNSVTLVRNTNLVQKVFQWAVGSYIICTSLIFVVHFAPYASLKVESLLSLILGGAKKYFTRNDCLPTKVNWRLLPWKSFVKSPDVKFILYLCRTLYSFNRLVYLSRNDDDEYKMISNYCFFFITNLFLMTFFLLPTLKRGQRRLTTLSLIFWYVYQL